VPWPETSRNIPEQGNRVADAPSRPKSEAPLPTARQPTSLRDRLKPAPAPAVEAGQLVENVPRHMCVGHPEAVEIRIAREHAAGTMVGLQGHGPPVRHDLYITKAMSVRLRAPDGGFRIEAASPETQWTEPAMGSLSGEFASWRFMVTPERRGEHTLQLVVAARVIGSDGLTAETTLPDQVITVHVRANYVRGFARWSGWLAALAIGGLIGKLSEDGFASLLQLLHRQFGG
jgi:neural Wiskott-Aldrich syndrome protein